MNKKEEELKGGLKTLFGERGEELSSTRQGNLEDTINDEELKEALQKRRMEKRGRPRKGTPVKESERYGRTSLIVNLEKYAKVKEIAFRNTLTTKEVLEAALDLLISKYESIHGEVIPTGVKEKEDVNSILFKK